MRVEILLLALLVTSASISPPAEVEDPQSILLHSSTDVSSAKRKPQQPPQQATGYYSIRRFADPSFGPDGRPYKVPEYLRNQCYIDDGYGRFSACNNNQ